MSGLYHRKRAALPATYLHELETAVMASPYLGASALGTEFVETRGFSIIFRRTAMAEVRRRFPYLNGFIDAAVFPSSNAFYINPLVLTTSSRVDSHVDCRLVAEAGVRIVPTLISVLYVRCPGAESGGALVFDPDTEAEVRLQPEAGDLVHFRGRQLHAVAEVVGAAPRISVVCEQYNLPADALAGFPELVMLSTAGYR